ncbi:MULTISPECIES: DUF1795 domain-containing protein [Erwinia]|uniref:DUF1795 domain-containing protein n=1 Tax=Erwinia papayae TaxID=206499 RepID=A0ABV3N3K8_9GAMM|nr:DUF1795 domain-containing protein [Erwinia mallotivora]
MKNNRYYHLSEGKITLPDNYIDRTINTIIDKNSIMPAINISRDKLGYNQLLTDYITQQYQQLIPKLSGWKEEPRTPAYLGAGRLQGTEVTFSFLRQPEQRLWQKQAIFVLEDNDVLIFSLSKSTEFDEQDKIMLDNLLQSFTPHD